MSDNFHENLKTIREAKKMTGKELSKKLGIAQSTYSGYETGYRKPNLDIIQQIAYILDTDINTLLGYNIHPILNDNITQTNTFDKLLYELGYRWHGDPDELYCWIEYPDGTLEVNKEDIEELQNSALSYLKFKLEELKQKNYKHFRPKK